MRGEQKVSVKKKKTKQNKSPSSEVVILLVKVFAEYLLCARSMWTCWDLGSQQNSGGTKEVLIAILPLWFRSRARVRCHDVTISLE